MPNFDLSQAEVEFLTDLVDEECNYWQENIEGEANRQTAIVAATLLGRLRGKDAQTAELEARREVDTWMAEHDAPGGL